jgi:RHS repeat-associated protein
VRGTRRLKTVSASSGQNPVTNTVYNTASQVTEVNFGSLDKDTFQYDANTGRLTQYKFFVGTPTVTGNLTWNANGTVQTLALTDGFNAANTQTCNYTYDDLTRIKTANCGTPWNQTFSFDPFGNIAKSGTSSFAAGYLLADGSTNNRIQSLPGVTPAYDTNGNLTSDGAHTYSWDAEGRPVQMDTTTLTYDALGRMVEKAVGSTYTEMVYSPLGGKLALMNGQALVKAFVPLPGGATAVYTASGLAYYRHPDWLGSSRLASTPTRTKYYDVAYAPYGESYAGSGTTDLSFTGQNQDAVAGHYDFLFREYNPVHGRWISPDPAGLGAVSIANPQSWNRYGYVLNAPLQMVDPLGLDGYYFAGGCVYYASHETIGGTIRVHVVLIDCGGTSGGGGICWSCGPVSTGGGPISGGGGGGKPEKPDTPPKKPNNCDNAPDVTTAGVGGDLAVVSGIGAQTGLAANGKSGELSLTLTMSLDVGVVAPDAYVYSGIVKSADSNDDLNTPSNVPATSYNAGVWRAGVSVDRDTGDFQATFGPSAWYVSAFIQQSVTKTLATIPYVGYLLNPQRSLCKLITGE